MSNAFLILNMGNFLIAILLFNILTRKASLVIFFNLLPSEDQRYL